MDSGKINLTREVIYNEESLKLIKKFETSVGYPLRQVPLAEVVGIEPSLIQQKVMDLVLQGAEMSLVRASDIATVVTMDSEKIEQPVLSYTDFKVFKGTYGSKGRRSGGLFDAVELDCSGQNGLRIVDVALDKSWVKHNKWGAVEMALSAAGNVMMEEVIGSVMLKYETDVFSTMTDTVANWGADHYKSLVKGLSLIAGARLPTDVVVINSEEIYDLLILDYFIHQSYQTLAGRQDFDYGAGVCGFLLPNRGIPIYFTPKATAASMTVASKRGAIIGIYEDLTVENYNAIRDGEEGAILSMQWDVKSGKDAKLSKPTKKAWAVVTGA